MVPLIDQRSPGTFAETLRLDPEAWAIRINARWRQSRENIIETGRLLLDAKAACVHGTFEKEVVTRLHFSPNVAQRLMAIARDPRLSNPAHVQLLPPSWGTLYELTKLSDEEFDRGVQQQIIRPDMERKEVEILRPTPHRAKPDSEIPEPAESGDPDQNAAGGPSERPSMAAEQAGEQDAGETTEAGASGSSSPALLAPVDPAAVEGADGDDQPHAPPASISDAPAAHMAGRIQPNGDLDYSPTPPWATRALVERVLRHAGREGHCKFQSAWEPACGEGHMGEVLREYFRIVLATDIHARGGYPDRVENFLEPEVPHAKGQFDWIITNPPFEDRVLKFMDRALDLAGTGVAMFLQLRYLEGIGRYERIYRDRPPTIVAPFVERVPLLMGQYDPKASTTTAFMWLVWLKGAVPEAPFWIPPGCKDALTKPDDAERFTQHPVRRASTPTSEAAE
jgi:hypothetical protein